MVPLQADECSRHDQDSCGKQEQPQAVLSLPLAQSLGLLLDLVSFPQQEWAGPLSTLASVVAEPTSVGAGG